MKIKLDQEIREKLMSKDKIKLLEDEKQALAKEKDVLTKELDTVLKERELIKDTSSKAETTMRTLAKDKSRLEKYSEKLAKDNREKFALIGQLEKVGSSLRSELMETRDELNKITKDLQSYKKENHTLNEKLSDTNSEQEIKRLLQQEIVLKESLEKLKHVHEEVVFKSKTMEERLSRVEGEELLNLKAEWSEAKAKAKDLKSKMNRLEKSNATLKMDKEALNEQLRAEENSRDKVEAELHNLRVRFADCQSQFSALQIQNSGLNDDAVTWRQESLRLKEQMEQIASENAILNGKRTELEIRVEALNKKNSELNDKSKTQFQEGNQIVSDLNQEIGE